MTHILDMSGKPVNVDDVTGFAVEAFTPSCGAVVHYCIAQLVNDSVGRVMSIHAEAGAAGDHAAELWLLLIVDPDDDNPPRRWVCDRCGAQLIGYEDQLPTPDHGHAPHGRPFCIDCGARMRKVGE